MNEKTHATHQKTRTLRPRAPAPKQYDSLAKPSHCEHSGVKLGRNDPPRANQPAIPAAHTGKSTPSTADIDDGAKRVEAALRAQPAQECKSAKPPAPHKETWPQAAKGLARDVGKFTRKAVELFGTALVAVASPILTAAVDGICVIVFVLTVWELWTPAKAVADALATKCGIGR